MNQLQEMPVTTSDGQDRTLWYVPDDRIKTKAAVTQAIEVAKWVAVRHGMNPEPDEQALFIALHTCAFQALRYANGKLASPAKHDEWVLRWRAIREHLVERNLGLVHICIRRFRVAGLDEDDAMSEAMCGLGRAIDRFNPWRGFRFSTYACNIITRALMRRGKGESRYRHIFPVQHDESYEKAVEAPDGHKELCLDRLRVVLSKNLGNLTDLEATVLSHRFCEDNRSELTYQQIGKIVGLSKERIRQIQNTALAKLRSVLREDAVLA